MADNHSFDVVSEINHAEMHNAVVQAQHEIAVRYDFKGTNASIEFDKKENKLTILAEPQGSARNRHPGAQGEDGSPRRAGRMR